MKGTGINYEPQANIPSAYGMDVDIIKYSCSYAYTGSAYECFGIPSTTLGIVSGNRACLCYTSSRDLEVSMRYVYITIGLLIVAVVAALVYSIHNYVWLDVIFWVALAGAVITSFVGVIYPRRYE